MPSISGRQCAVLRLLHGSLGCMASSHRSCWRFVKGHLRKPWLFWQKSRWSAQFCSWKWPENYEYLCSGLRCYSIIFTVEQSAWWSKAVLLFMAFPPSSADLPASLRLRVLYKVPLAFGACGGANGETLPEFAKHKNCVGDQIHPKEKNSQTAVGIPPPYSITL